MRIVLIADTFPPIRTSGAVQLRDLAREFERQGHDLTVLLPCAEQNKPWHLEEFESVRVLRLKAPRTKDIGYVRRTLAEFLMPFAMLWRLRESPLKNECWDGVVWYAPSIFHAPLVSFLKNSNHCKGYLIIRDIFPEWAVDMGLMGRGLLYRFFDAVARYQYSVADIIGVQTVGNQAFFMKWQKKSGRRLEVLQNWLDDAPGNIPCSIDLSQTSFKGRKVFVYAGNMGVAQGMDMLLDLSQRLQSRSDVGFLFVGRGSEAERLKDSAKKHGMTNVLFYDEIHPDEIPNLYKQCSIGLVALDPRHRSHNIPGKFLTYLQNGLPVLANVNSGNDIADMIRRERVGSVCESNQLVEFAQRAEELLSRIDTDTEISERCQMLFSKEFSTKNAVKQIVSALRK